MSNWKVSKQQIQLFEHPNADSLELGKVGTYQVVVQKGVYKNKQEVVFIPEKSVLSGILKEEYIKYLVGPNKDRVKAIKLRGELSGGIIIPDSVLEKLNININELSIDEDISSKIDVKQYEPPIPSCLQGKVSGVSGMLLYGHHDCEHFGVYAHEFVEGERVVITEKVHGSSVTYYIYKNNGIVTDRFVSTKRMLKRGLQLLEEEENAYWQAAKNIGVFDIMEEYIADKDRCILQVFGEIIPIQKGFDYGQTKMVAKIFDIRLDNISVPYDQVSNKFKSIWIPIIYDGPLDKNTVRKLSEGNEQVSGKEEHIREGVVVAPYIDRIASDGTRLRMKILNPAYKETGEEFN